MTAPAQSDQFDFFVSYARKDNQSGWITQFLDALQAEHRSFTGGREFRCFFDKEDIRSLDAWQHRIYDSLDTSRLFLAFVSPAYFASEWCRREWRTWVDVEIAKHILSDGAAPVYIVEVPWLAKTMSEQEVAESIAALTKQALAELKPGLAADAAKVASEMSLRQLTQARDFYTDGLDALRREDLRKVLTALAKDLADRTQHVADAAKSLSTIPPYNRRFVGRLEELVRLRERLFQGRTGVISGHQEGSLPQQPGIASVHGLGGIGKTELAFTYAHAFAGLYPGGRFLIQCEHLTDLRLALLQLDSLFPGAATDEQRKSLDLHFGAIREAMRARLGQMGRILLVLDNVSDLTLLAPEQTDLVRILGSQLHLLATTRLGAPVGQGADEDIHWLTLGELSFEDSLRLLEKHRPFDETERVAAEKIAQRLGGFALCVEVVGAYLGQHPEESYAGFLETMGLDDLEHVDGAAERKETVTRRHNNEKRLGAILALTLAKLTTAERTTLDFASLLAPDHVVLPWLRELTATVHLEVSSDLADTGDAWRNIEDRLMSLALLVRGDDDKEDLRVVRCHRLVQDYLRHGMDDEVEKQNALVTWVKGRDAVLENTIRWQEAKWELPPLTGLAQLWDEQCHRDAAWLSRKIGLRWHILANTSEAEPLLRRALAIDETNYGSEHHEVAMDLSDLAWLLQDTNRLAEAEPLSRRALAIEEATFGGNHPAVARQLSNLGRLLQATNRLVEAEEHFSRALQIALHGTDSDLTLYLTNLAQLLKVRHRFAEAEPLMREALASGEAHYGADHPYISSFLLNLAQLLQDTDRHVEAEPLIRRALAIDEASFGAEHPTVAIDLHTWAMSLDATGRMTTEVEPLYRRALAIDEASYGAGHPKVAKRLNNLAGLLFRATRRFTEVEPLMRRALAIDEASFGPDHPNVTQDLNNLARLLLATNRPAEAEPLIWRALASDEASFGSEHPQVAEDLNRLAEFLQDTSRHAEAEPLLRRALKINEATFGRDHNKVADSLMLLAELLQATSRHADAEPLLRRALAICEAAYGPQAPSVATCLNMLALGLQATAQLVEAEHLFRRALAIDEVSNKTNSCIIGRDLNNLAKLLKETNHLEEAAQHFQRAMLILAEANHAEVLTSVNGLAQILQANHQFVDAEQLMRRAVGLAERLYGIEHAKVADSLTSLAGLLQTTNKLDDVEVLTRRALAIHEANLGPQHPNVAIDLSRLAQLLHNTNRPEEAEPLMRRALAIDEASYGKDDPRVAIDLNNLAGLHFTAKRLADAEPLMRRALAIDEASFGSAHAHVASDLKNLTQLLKATNRLTEAEALLRRALAIDEVTFGLAHLNVAADLSSLAGLLKKDNRLSEAEPFYRRSLSILQANLGAEHPDVADDLFNLASLLRASNRLMEAEQMIRQTVLIFLKFTVATGHTHPHLQIVLPSYGTLCQEMEVPFEEFFDRLAGLGAQAGLESDTAMEILQTALS